MHCKKHLQIDPFDQSSICIDFISTTVNSFSICIFVSIVGMMKSIRRNIKRLIKRTCSFLFIEVVRPLVHFVFHFNTKMCTSKMPSTQSWNFRRTLKDFGISSTFPACFYSEQTKNSCRMRFGMLSSIFHDSRDSHISPPALDSYKSLN